MKTVFIYGLTCPTNGELRYVGETNSPKRRKMEHVGGYDNHFCPRTCWIRKLSDLGLKPGFVVIDEIPEEYRRQLEVAYIAFFRESGCDLLNSTVGGDGLGGGKFHPSYGKARSATTKKKISLANKGKKRSFETCEKIRKAATGRTHSVLTRRKMSAAHIGKEVSLETQKRLSAANIGKGKSSEHREKLSLSNSGEKSFFFGKKRPIETREKMRAAALIREERKRQAAILSEMWR